MSEEESTTTEAPEAPAEAAPAAAAKPAPADRPRGLRKERTGIVVSDKMDKTIVVAVVIPVSFHTAEAEAETKNNCLTRSIILK